MFRKSIKLSFIVLFTLASFGQIRAAVTVDSTSSTADFTLGGVRANPITFMHTVSGAGEVLYVGVSNNRTLTANPTQFGCPVALPATGTVTAISYGSQTNFEPLTRQDNNLLDTIVSPNGCASVEVFRLKNPTPGINVTISVSIPTGGDYVVIGAVSFIGADSSTPAAGALVPASGSSATPAVTVSTPFNGLVLDTIAAEFNSLSVIEGADQIRRWRLSGETPDPPPTDYVGAGSTESGIAGSSVVMSWTLNASGNWALGGTFIKELLLAAPVSVRGRVMSPFGRGLGRVRVRLTEADGTSRTALTNSFGYYNFEDLSSGQTVTLEAFSKQFNFAPQIITVNENMLLPQFTHQE